MRPALAFAGRPEIAVHLYPGAAPSQIHFNITVPKGRLWVMGDNRAVSDDSRLHTNDPGGGTVPEPPIDATSTGRRKALANWIVDGQAPADFKALSYDRLAAGKLFVGSFGGNRG